jgi:quercetin dioxygenase-like cupin family protein
MMRHMMTRSRWQALVWMSVGLVLGSVATQALQAQQSGIQRVILFRTDVAPSSAPMEMVLGTGEIPAAGNAGKHSHTGMEVGYVLNGEVTMEVAGEAPRALQAGDHYFIPAGLAHDAIATSAGPAKVLAFYLVEKGKPLATPAP